MSLGEITQLPKNLALNTRCSCGSPIRECPLWATVVDRLAAHPRFRAIRENPYVLDLGLFEAGTVIDEKHQTRLRRAWRKAVYAGAYAHWRSGLKPLAAFAHPLLRGAHNKWRLFEVLTSLEPRLLVVDSSKHYLEAAALYAAEPQRTRILFLIRDGRAVFYSGLKRGKSPRAALDAWRLTYERAEPVLNRVVNSRDVLHVRYEALASDPAWELQRICGFIGLRYERGMLDFRTRAHHVANGNDMRLQGGAAIRLDEAWRTALTASDLEYFEANAGSLNRRLGYR